MELDPRLLLPEIILLAAACFCTLLGLAKRDSIRRWAQVIAAFACALAFAAAATSNFGLCTPSDFTNITKYVPPFNPNYITLLACAIGFLTILAAWDMPSKSDPSVTDSTYRGEFFGMLLFSLAGVAMIGKVNDLVWLFVVLELVSIPTYILVATGRSQIIAQEAGVKYFFLGALAAAIFLFGFSYLYGATGSTRFDDIHLWFARAISAHQHNSANAEVSMLAIIGLIMVIVGVGYKIAAVPLHFYAPDVYQGAATPVTAFLAFAPKTAGIVAIISILSLFNFNYTGNLSSISALLAVIAVLTMSIGNVLALLQRNLKRLLAYSSIAHSGYMLVGLVAMAGMDPGNDGVSATIFYLTSYAIMNLGAFAVLIYLQGKADAAEDFDDIAGIAKSHPAAALMLSLCLFSLIGMPLTIGFLGKFYIIQRALGTGHTALAVIVVINAAVAAAYYLKIIAAMYLREPLYPFSLRKSPAIRISAVICSVAVIAFFIAPKPLLEAGRPVPNASDAASRNPRSPKAHGFHAVGAIGVHSAIHPPHRRPLIIPKIASTVRQFRSVIAAPHARSIPAANFDGPYPSGTCR